MKKRVFSFVAVYLFLVCTLSFYIGARVAEQAWHWALLGLLSALLLLLPTLHWKLESRILKVIKDVLQQGTFFSVGFMSWLLVFVVVRDLTLLLGLLTLGSSAMYPFEKWTSGDGAFFAAMVLSFSSLVWAMIGLRVRKISVIKESLPESLNGFKIAQISDLHVGPTIGKKYVERVVRKVNALKPDVTVLTGDIVDGGIEDFKFAAQTLSKLEPASRVYYVPGNHEYYWEYEAWLQAFSAWGLNVLVNRGENFKVGEKSFWVGGVADPMGAQLGPEHAPNVQQAYDGGESAAFKLLLAHRPDPAPEASKVGFDLQLSGHTHGGQFFPWTYVAKFFHKHYLGLEKEGPMWIYVNPGTGWWGPPMRMGTTPEISLIELKSSKI